MKVASSAGDTSLCLILQAGQNRCAVPVHQIRRVVRAVPVYPLPGASPELLGLAEIEGEPVPILDLARLIQSPPGGTPSCPVHVIVEYGSEDRRERVALAADAALEIIPVAAGTVVGPPAGVVRGETVAGDQPVQVLDLSYLEDS